MLRTALLLLLATTAFAQKFEVASIKLHPNCSGGNNGPPTPGHLQINCIPVRQLIIAAFGTFDGSALRAARMDAVGGPAWLDSDRYDLSAKAEDAASVPQMAGPMLRALLGDRFALKLRKEARDKPIYALTVVKGQSKLQPAKEGSCLEFDFNHLPERASPEVHYCGTGGSHAVNGSTVAEWWGVTMPELAGRLLSGQVDRPVVDSTGITGRYDIRLEYTSGRPRGPIMLNGAEAPPSPPSDSDGLTIYAALEKQLGLKLASEKRPVDVLVIESIERPTEN